MITVTYDHEFPYSHDRDGERYPRLALRVQNPDDPTQAVDVEAYLDSGAQRSLLGGWIGQAIGIDILEGPQLKYGTTAGNVLEATLHQVRIDHPDLGVFDLELGFSSSPIRRNLIGRDFFNLVQVGFREHELSFYITAAP